MKLIITQRIGLLVILVLCISWLSCTRNDIAFGNVPDNNYTNLVSIDTVESKLSTVVLDSFATGSANSFLLGKYKDPYLGIVSAKPFFQMTIPAEPVSIASTSQFDSACLVIRLKKYYYGDTSREQTINANEIAQTIDYTYNNNLYNTSDFPVKPLPLGSKTLKLRPSDDDSVMIRISNSKGSELFSKLQQQSDEVASDENFQSYIKGISLSVNQNDTTAIYGLNGAAGNTSLRIYYHTTAPYPEAKSIDFPSKANTYSFNQILTDRNGTLLYSSSTGTKEYASEQTNNIAFTQYGAGVLLKITFPSLKGILTTDKIVKLQKAELVIRPIGQSYNDLKLPETLYLAATDGTNMIGAPASSMIAPVEDEIYEVNTYYAFDVTSYVNTLLTTSASEDKGFFVIENNGTKKISRAVIGNGKQSLYKTQLVLTLFTINK